MPARALNTAPRRASSPRYWPGVRRRQRRHDGNACRCHVACRRRGHRRDPTTSRHQRGRPSRGDQIARRRRHAPAQSHDERIVQRLRRFAGWVGTLEEFFEILTWSQLGIHRKPSGLLNVRGYYDDLLAMLDHAVTEGFLLPANRKLVIADTNAEALVRRLASLCSASTEPNANAAGNFL